MKLITRLLKQSDGYRYIPIIVEEGTVNTFKIYKKWRQNKDIPFMVDRGQKWIAEYQAKAEGK